MSKMRLTNIIRISCSADPVSSCSRWVTALAVTWLVGCGDRLEIIQDDSSHEPPTPGHEIVESENQSTYMRGLPPPRDKLINDDHSWALDPDKAKWSFQNVSKFLVTDAVSRGVGTVTPLSYAEASILGDVFSAPDGAQQPLRAILGEIGVDGFILIKNGVTHAEAYYNGLTPSRRHIAFSVTKSLVGTLVGILVHEGRIDLSQNVAHYLPELAESGVADVTIRQVLDMTTNVVWSHDRNDPASQVDQNSKAGGFQSRPEDFPFHNTLEFLQSLEKAGEHGQVGVYNPGNTEILGWIVSRLEGKHWQDVFAERIWSKIGAEHDALVAVDPGGHGFATAGFNATLRDFARFGLMLENDGRANGQQIVPADWLKDTRYGDEQALKAWRASDQAVKRRHVKFYRNHFRVLDDESGEFVAQGHMGQRIYVNMDANVVAVFLSVTPSRELRDYQVDLVREINHHLAGAL